MSSSSIAAFPLHRAIRPEHRYYSSLASSLAPPRVLFPKILTPSRILSPISVPFAFTKAVNAEDKIRRTDGDENLLRVLEDKIDELSPLEAELPNDSPFAIIDKSGNRSIKLKREFRGEKIEVFAWKYFDGDEDEEESEQDAAEWQNTDDDRHPQISLFITIDKAGPALMFRCNLYAEDCKIWRVMLAWPKYFDEGFNYYGHKNISDGSVRALNEYMGARGIKVLCKFLWEYFVTMDDRKCIVCLKNLKEFVEK